MLSHSTAASFFVLLVSPVTIFPAGAEEKAKPAVTQPATASAAEGFVPLFDGKSLDGWTNPYTYGKAVVADGEIQLTAEKKFFLCTTKSYANFVFEADVHLPEGQANSGFMFRANVVKNKVFGYQAEVDGSTDRKWSGGLYDEGRRAWFISPRNNAGKDATEADKAACKESIAAFRKRAGEAFKRNDWNKYRITCQGKKLKIEVNGVVTSDVEDDKDASGPVGIQHHGEKGQTYRFRNLRIKELKA